MDTWVITVISLIGSTALSTLIGCLIKNSVAKKVDEQNELNRLRAEHEREEHKEEVVKTMRAELQPIHTKIDKVADTLDGSIVGTITLLRESMKQARDKFMAQGFASTSDIASWHELYSTYKKLGGNHFIEYVNGWKDDVESLPREIEKK